MSMCSLLTPLHNLLVFPAGLPVGAMLCVLVVRLVESAAVHALSGGVLFIEMWQERDASQASLVSL